MLVEGEKYANQWNNSKPLKIYDPQKITHKNWSTDSTLRTFNCQCNGKALLGRNYRVPSQLIAKFGLHCKLSELL